VFILIYQGILARLTQFMDNMHPAQRLIQHIDSYVKGQPRAIRHVLAAFISGGHVLLEDLPGTGKTTLAKVLAGSLQAEFRRIQFTPDLLPSDIVGVSIFNQRDQVFQFHRGPVFTEILLADEINRASPRTQSALLEAMEEKQVSVDGIQYALSELFFVIATQNPLEFHGTYPLPEAQMDRFALRTQLGYLSLEDELALLSHPPINETLNNIKPCLLHDDLLTLRHQAKATRVSDEIKHYIIQVVRATRTAPGAIMGASPRAAFTLLKTAQALALLDGLEFVLPEHIQELAEPTIAHRLKVDSHAHFAGQSGSEIVQAILRDIPVPV
jgi:MoxR-like ATPase